MISTAGDANQTGDPNSILIYISAVVIREIERAQPSRSSFEDAEHVAIATINNLDAVVSWNFKHLVNLRRIKLVNLVNEQMGYKHIEIISPQEVVDYE